MKVTLGILAALLLATLPVAAQTADEVQVSISGFELATNGAEKASGVRFTTGPVKMGQPAAAMFWVSGCGYFSLKWGPPYTFGENATAGWRVEMTPLKIVDHAVTFRLRWTRALDTSMNNFEPPHEDLEITLKPGESRPIDSVPVRADAKTIDGKPCSTKAASLRVSADFPDMDSRLVGADLWLVERVPGGKERTQALSVRGLFDRAIPFYFDSVVEGTKRLDFFGKLVADPVEGGFSINLEAIRAAGNPAPEWGYWSVRWFRSTIHVKPNEVIDIALPPLDSKDAPFADRGYSIRIKPRQIR